MFKYIGGFLLAFGYIYLENGGVFPPLTKVVQQDSANSESFAAVATWYGGQFHGQCMANGKRFNKNAYTAANLALNLPYGTQLEVTLDGVTVPVVITDKGSLDAAEAARRGIQKRDIDLSEGAARALGMKRDGIKEVQVRIISKPEHSVKYFRSSDECVA